MAFRYWLSILGANRLGPLSSLTAKLLGKSLSGLISIRDFERGRVQSDVMFERDSRTLIGSSFDPRTLNLRERAFVHLIFSEGSRAMFQYSSLLCQVEPQEAVAQLLPDNLLELLGLNKGLPEGVYEHNGSIATHTFAGTRGQIRLAFDGIRLVIECSQKERPIFRGAIRDRQLDATDGQSPLAAFPNQDPACNRLAHPGLLAAELSIYSWHPEYFLSGIDTPGTLGHFVADPDYYIWKNFHAQTFFPLLTRAMGQNHAPWQRARPIPGAARHFVTNAATLLKKLGYHLVDEVPSWFNVVGFFKKLGYQFTYGEHAATYDKIVASLTRFSNLSLHQQAWLVALQNLPEAMIPLSLRLGVRWPVTHTNQYWVRMHLNLNEPPASNLEDTICAEAAEREILSWQTRD